VTGAPDNQQLGNHGGPVHVGRHDIGDEQVAAVFADAFGWPSDAGAAGADESLRDAFVSSATRALGPHGAGDTPTPNPAEVVPEAPPASAGPLPQRIVATPGQEQHTMTEPIPVEPDQHTDPSPGGVHEASSPDPAAVDRIHEALATCELAPGYVAATVVLLPDGAPIAHRCRFPALSGEGVGRLVVRWVEGLAAAVDELGGQELFGLIDTGMITTEAATIHLGLLDDRHVVVVITDVASDEASLLAARNAMVHAAVAVDNLLG
jgi:hypothetical protein